MNKKEFAHKCPKCMRRWTHRDCDGIGNPKNPEEDKCRECGGQPVLPIFEDDFGNWARTVREEAGIEDS